jgi:hypothetical protein
MKTILSFLFLSLLGGIAQAQTTRSTPCDPATPSNAVCIGWSPVITRVDGLPTTFPVTYRVEQQIGSGAFAAIATVSTSQHYAKNLAPGVYTFRVFAIENLLESAPSNTAGKTIVQANPGAPVITIAVVISSDRSPVYRIVGSVEPFKRGEMFGLIPVGRACTGPVVFRYRNASFRRVKVESSEVWPVGSSVENLAAPCA